MLKTQMIFSSKFDSSNQLVWEKEPLLHSRVMVLER